MKSLVLTFDVKSVRAAYPALSDGLAYLDGAARHGITVRWAEVDPATTELPAAQYGGLLDGPTSPDGVRWKQPYGRTGRGDGAGQPAGHAGRAAA